MNKPKSTTKKTAKAKKPAAKTTVDAKGHASVIESDPPVGTTAKPAKAPKEKAPKEDLMVFAFRLTKEESAAIHKAAGPGKASKFARTLLVAAARNDEVEVKAILKTVHTQA